MADLNRVTFDWINGWPDAMAPMMRFFSEATNYREFKVFLVLLVLAMIVAKGRAARAAVQSLIAFPIANEITDLLKQNLPRARPCNELTNIDLHGIGCSESFGTASAHSANMAAVAFAMTYHLGWRGSIWIPLALLTGLSRIYVGAHYPYQVLFGWTCGVLAALLVTKSWDLWRRRRASSEPVSEGVRGDGVPLA